MTNAMTARNLQAAIDQAQAHDSTPAMVQFESLLVPCLIVQTKSAYGRRRALVRAVGGVGEQWVDVGRIKNNGGTEK